MIRAISSIRSKPNLDTHVYSGSLNPEELIECIGEVENLFEFGKILYPWRFRFVSTKLRRHASLWWVNWKLNIECSGREKIKTWDRMVSKLKCNFFLVYYA